LGAASITSTSTADFHLHDSYYVVATLIIGVLLLVISEPGHRIPVAIDASRGPGR
jgi:hypothetical protein